MARAVRAALAEHDGDILAFLPGMAEIRRTQAALEGCGALVLPLHGDLPPAEQDRALRPAEGRRVVLATSIAETSLTVPGVRIVVDGGWRRAPRLDPVHRADAAGDAAYFARGGGAAGRAGGARGARASRSGCGPRRCIAAWPRTTGPRSSRRSCRGWRWIAPPGDRAPADLAFLDPPPPGALAAATALLGGTWRTRCRRGASPTPDGAWPRSARIRGWRQ